MSVLRAMLQNPIADFGQAIGPHQDLLTIVKRHKLQWYGHVSCSSGLAKTTLQGTVKGGRRQGRQRNCVTFGGKLLNLTFLTMRERERERERELSLIHI